MGAELWFHDTRLAVRGLLRHPGYSLPALLTLTLGVGAGTAMFGVLQGVVLAPLPYPESDRLVQVSLADPVQGTRTTFSLPDVEDFEEQSRTLEHLGAYTTLPSDLILSGADEALEVETAYVTPGFLPALGTEPLHGRVFRREDDQGDNRVVVVSHAFWRQHFGADPGAVGTTLELSGEPYRLIGVLPPEVAFPDTRVEAWVLLSVIPASSIPLHIRGVNLLRAVGRLAPGVTPAQAEEELSAIAAELARLYPDSNERATGAAVQPLRESIVGDVRGALRLLMAAGGVILLIMCANLANLALVREARRAPEVAVRSALGASRARRAGLVLTESLVLSLVGGGLGLLLAHWSTGLLLARSADTLPRAHEVGVDFGVAVFALGVSVFTGL
ncbi:MAG: ABC transporter permease, partial [Gemmatimonadota bacterium]